jgi:hypothetical protein
LPLQVPPARCSARLLGASLLQTIAECTLAMVACVVGAVLHSPQLTRISATFHVPLASESSFSRPGFVNLNGRAKLWKKAEAASAGQPS